MRRIPAVVGLRSQLLPNTWVDAYFEREADVDEAEFERAVARAGYRATKVTISDLAPRDAATTE